MSEILISIACIAITSVACVGGIMSKHYRDNWLQFFGLWLIFAWSLGRGWQLSMRWYEWISNPVVPEPNISTQQLIGHLGLALFALGTAWKVWRHREVIEGDGDMQRAKLQ